MSSPFASEFGPPPLRSRFQFDLRTMLALTALVAWGISWEGGGAHLWGISALAGLALIEAGCCPREDVLTILVRNLAAYFVCSLCFGLFGFGLMFGDNPTGFFGTSEFFLFPFGHDPSLPAEAEAEFRIVWLRFFPRSFALAIAVVHWPLAGRVRWPAYLLCWLFIGGLALPVMLSWMVGGSFPGLGEAGDGEGWLARLGAENWVGALLWPAAGFTALAAALAFRPARAQVLRRLGLLAPNCSRLLVILGAAVFLMLSGPVSVLWAVIVSDDVSLNDLWPHLLPGGLGLFSAACASLIFFRRFSLTVVLCGGVGGMIAFFAGGFLSGWLVPAALGLVAGGLVVFASWVFDRLRFDDPGGAVAICGVCGVLGIVGSGLLSALFSMLGLSDPYSFGRSFDLHSLRGSCVAVVSCFIWAFSLSLGLFLLIKHLPGFSVVDERPTDAEVVPQAEPNGASHPTSDKPDR